MPNSSDLEISQTLEDVNSQSDQLHGVLQSKMQKPYSEWGRNDHSHINDLISHPNTTTDHLTKLYSHIMPQDATAPEGGVHVPSYDADSSLNNLFNSGKAASSDAEDFLKRTWKNSDGYTTRGSHAAAATVGGVSGDLLKDLTLKHINDPKVGNVPGYKLPASFIHSIYDQRQDINPIEGVLNENQKNHNSKMLKIDKLFFNNISTADHDEPEIQKTVDFLTRTVRPTGTNYEHTLSATGKILDRPDLKSDQIEKLFESARATITANDSYSDHSIPLKTFDHQNVSKDLISKVALSPPEVYDDSIKVAALRSKNLPKEVVDRIINDYNPDQPQIIGNSYFAITSLQLLAKNPEIDESTLVKIYEKGNSRDKAAAVVHPKAPHATIEDYWSKQDKKTDSTKFMLSSVQNVPPSVLRDIVGKNKNQDLSISALNHKNADISVVQEGLKRRAATVQEAAALHPLVAKQQVNDRLADGRLDPHEFLVDKKIRKASGDITPEQVNIIDEHYKEKPHAEYKGKDFEVKRWLSTNENVDPVVRDRNKSELLSMFSNNVTNDVRIDRNTNYSGNNSSLAYSVVAMAHEGDVSAQDALLEKPQLLRDVDYGREGLSSGFLASSYAKAESLYPTDDYNDKRSLSYMKNSIISHPNTPQDIFDTFTLNPEEYSSGSSLQSKVYTRWNRGEKAKDTVFDDRYWDSTEEEKIDGYNKVLALNNPLATFAVARSQSAPKEIFAKAWQGLTEPHKTSIIERQPGRLKDLDSNAYSAAIRGSNSRLQSLAMTHMDMNNEAHVDALDTMIKQVFGQINPQSQPGYKRPEEIIKALGDNESPDKVMFNDNYDRITRSALSVSDDLGVRLALKKMTSMDKDLKPEEKILKLRTMFQSASQTQEDVNLKWHSAIEKGLHLDRSKGTLDFLYNLPGDAENGYSVRNAGIAKNIFSDSIMINAAMESGEGFKSALQGKNSIEKNKMLRDTLAMESVSADIIDTIVDHISPSTIMPKVPYRGSKMSPDDFSKSVDNLSVMVAGLIRHNKTDRLSDLAVRLTGNNSDGSFTKANQKKIIGAISDSVDSDTAMSVSQKNKIKFDIWHEMQGRNRESLLPGNILKGVAEIAIETKDIDIMIDIMQKMGRPPTSIQKEIVKIAKKPEVLSSDQLMSLGNVIDNDSITAETSKSIISSIQKKATTESPEKSRDMHLKVLGLASKMIATTKDSKRLVGSGIINAYLNDEDPRIKYTAMGYGNVIARNHNLPMKERVSTFLNLAIDHPDYATDAFSKQRFGSDFINNEEVLLNSTHGWKLDLYTYNADAINDNTANVIVDRIMAANPGEEGLHTRKQLMLSLFENENVKNEAKAKLYNSLDPETKYNITSDTLDRRNRYFISGGAYTGLRDSADFIDRSWKESVEAGGAKESRAYTETFNRLSTLNEVVQIHDNPFGQLSINNDEGQEAINDHIGRSIKIASDVHSRMMSRLDNSPEEVSASEFDSYITGLRTYCNSIFRQDAKRSLGDHSMKSLSMVTAVQDSMNAYKSKNGHEATLNDSGFSDRESFNDYHVGVAMNWTKWAQIEDKDWKTVSDKLPHFAYFLGQRSSIPAAALDAVDLSKERSGDGGYMYLNDFFDNLDSWPEKVSKQDHDALIRFSDRVLENSHRMLPRPKSDFFEKVAKTLGEKLKYDDVQKIAKSFGDTKYKEVFEAAAASSGAGGLQYLHDVIDRDLGQNHIEGVMSYAHKAKLDEAAVNKIMPAIFNQGDDHRTGQHVEKLIKNDTLSNSALQKIHSFADISPNRRIKDNILRGLQMHPNVDFDLFNKLYHETKDKYGDHHFEVGTTFNPAFKNRKFGGRLFREQPVTIPDGQPESVDRDPGMLVKGVEYSKGKAGLRSAAELIPPEGISWAKFKSLSKQLAENVSVKEMFMSANKQYVTPEDVSRAIEMAGGDYHVTYASWDGIQRHMSDDSRHRDVKFKNLVMQLNTGEHMEKQLSADPKLWAFFQMIQTAGNRTNGNDIGGHPVTPHNAAWVRIDTSGGKEGWVIEETQSDFSASLRKQIDTIAKSHPQGLTLEGEFYHPEDLEKHAKRVEKIIGGWHEAAMKAATELAKRQGVKNLFLHGEGVRSIMSFGSGNDERVNPAWMQHMYTNWPKKNGWESVDYTSYPNWSKDMLDQSSKKPQGSKCWKLKIS